MNVKQILNDKKLTDKEAIERIKAAYDDFSLAVRKIEKERDEKIIEIIKKIETRRLEK